MTSRSPSSIFRYSDEKQDMVAALLEGELWRPSHRTVNLTLEQFFKAAPSTIFAIVAFIGAFVTLLFVSVSRACSVFMYFQLCARV